MPPIVPRANRRLAAAIAAIAAAVTAALAIALQDAHGTRFDQWVLVRLYTHIGDTGRQMLLGISDPGIPIGFLALIAVGAALARNWRLAVLAVVGPLLAVGLTEVILKPVVHRTSTWTVNGVPYHALAYPSGHETGLVALLTVAALLLPRVQLKPASRAAAYALLVLWALAGAVGLVRGFYHFATDTIGGAGVALATVLGTALAIDAITDRTSRRDELSAPGARSPASTSRAA